jgi:hypothetical protein
MWWNEAGDRIVPVGSGARWAIAASCQRHRSACRKRWNSASPFAGYRGAAALGSSRTACRLPQFRTGRQSPPAVELDPPEFREESFRDDLPNLIQINVRGRILQVEFEATPELVSTEDFRVPYTLSGAVRAFNQALLDKDLIEEQLIFYTVEKDKNMWRFFDARTYRSGGLDRDYLIGLMEHLV